MGSRSQKRLRDIFVFGLFFKRLFSLKTSPCWKVLLQEGFQTCIKNLLQLRVLEIRNQFEIFAAVKRDFYQWMVKIGFLPVQQKSNHCFAKIIIANNCNLISSRMYLLDSRIQICMTSMHMSSNEGKFFKEPSQKKFDVLLQ